MGPSVCVWALPAVAPAAGVPAGAVPVAEAAAGVVSFFFFLKSPLIAPSVLSRPLLTVLEILPLALSEAPCAAVVFGSVTCAWVIREAQMASNRRLFFICVMFPQKDYKKPCVSIG